MKQTRLPGNPTVDVVIRDVAMTLCFSVLLYVCLDIWREVHGLGGMVRENAAWRQATSSYVERLDAIEQLVRSLTEKIDPPKDPPPNGR